MRGPVTILAAVTIWIVRFQNRKFQQMLDTSLLIKVLFLSRPYLSNQITPQNMADDSRVRINDARAAENFKK